VEDARSAVKSVLVVDDDPSVLEMVSSILVQGGYSVKTAASGPEALETVRHDQPGVILLDLVLPGRAGADFARELRRQGLGIPIIAMSGVPDASEWVAELNVHAYLAKPFDMSDLLSVVNRVGWSPESARDQARVLQEWLGAIADFSEDALIGVSPEGAITGWNLGAEQVYGYSTAEAIGQSIYLIVPPSRFGEMAGLGERVRRGERIPPYETIRRHRDGRDLVMSLSVTPIRDATGRVIGSITIGRDVTARVYADQERQALLGREKEARAEADALYDAAKQMTGSLDLSVTLSSILDSVVQLTESHTTGIALFDRSRGTLEYAAASGPGADRVKGVVVPYGEGISGRAAATQTLINVPNVAEEQRWAFGIWVHDGLIHSAMYVPLVAGGETIGVLGVWSTELSHFTARHEHLVSRLAEQAAVAIKNGQEIARRQQVEAELAASQARLYGLFHHSQDAILFLDDNARYVDANPAACAMSGYSREELLALPPDGLTARDSLESLQERWHRLIETGDQRGEFELVRKNGTTVIADYSSVANILPGLHLSILRDVTERRRFELQRQEAHKMESIGRLAGGVAHDFNNMLTVIAGYGELLAARLPANSPDHDAVEQIRRAADSATTLTSQLLAFSRRQVIAPKEIDLNAIVERTSRMLRRIVGEDINLVLSLVPRPGVVTADPGQIEQVLINLAANARDAMPTGGRFAIATANVDLAEDDPQRSPSALAGPYVRLSVTDTGHGMDLATRTRIFEPFFTTKDVGKGTGLGLAAVYGIVTQTGGWIEVESAVGAGTTFQIYLPQAALPVSSEPPETALRHLPTGTETILLIEDEDQVRLMAQHILHMCGYTVLAVSGGASVAELVASYAGPIHLLLTDVVMSGLSGRQIAQELAVIRPDVRILYTSGYTDDAVVRHGVTDATVAFLQKPFTPSTLATKVRQVLDAPGT
jgi:two-component system, cell cycle sensor histidine kinase and response regulator CckA